MILTFEEKLDKEFQIFSENFVNFFKVENMILIVDFEVWGKRIPQKIKIFFRKFFENFLKKLIIFQVNDFHNLNEIIKFRRKS